VAAAAVVEFAVKAEVLVLLHFPVELVKRAYVALIY
jgi:hypothetical protein